MKIGSAFPSKYLKASDIPDGKFVTVVIDRVQIENVAGDNDTENEKPVLYFQGKSKGMVLNKTNSGVITHAYGDETEEWSGKPILLYSTETLFQGQMVPCLRVKVNRQQGAPQRQTAAVAAAPRENGQNKRSNAAEESFPATGDQEFDSSDIPF